VVGTGWPLAVSRGVIDKRDWLGDPARRLVGVPEVVPRCQCVRVVRAEQPRAVGYDALTVAATVPVAKQIKPTAQQNNPGKLKRTAALMARGTLKAVAVFKTAQSRDRRCS
jgi:hypothetical protein